MGSSHAAVKDSPVWLWVVCMASGTPNAEIPLRTSETHHRPAAASTEPERPYALPCSAIPDTMVTRPMGIVPRKSECTGCDSMAGKMAGYIVYRAMVRKEKKRKSAMSRMRKVAPIARKVGCVDSHGKRKRRELHMPIWL